MAHSDHICTTLVRLRFGGRINSKKQSDTRLNPAIFIVGLDGLRRGRAIKYFERMVVAGALLIILTSVAGTVVLSRWLTSAGKPAPDTDSHRNITFTDAVLACRSEATSQLPAGLLTLTLDDHSSRFDQRERLYKIFLQAQVVRKAGDTEAIGVAVYCFVKADQGFVSYYEQLEQRDDDSGPGIKRPGGVFGWPI